MYVEYRPHLSRILPAFVFLLILTGATLADGNWNSQLFTPGQAIQPQTPQFDELREKFREGRIFSATFSHEYLDSYTGEESRTEGRIWIGSGMYRVESDEQVMIVAGGVSRVYDPVRNRVLISTYVEEDDDFAPSRMLQGVDDSYRVREESRRGNSLVTLISDDPFSVFTRVEITLNRGGLPERIEAVDQADNLLITRFRNGRFAQQDPALFELNVPEDAEQIDLRY